MCAAGAPGILRPMAWYDAVGLLGVVAILVAYALLQTGRLASRDLGFSLSNALGALLVLVSLWFQFNLSAALMELIWLVISGYGVWQAWRDRSAGPRGA